MLVDVVSNLYHARGQTAKTTIDYHEELEQAQNE